MKFTLYILHLEYIGDKPVGTNNSNPMQKITCFFQVFLVILQVCYDTCQDIIVDIIDLIYATKIVYPKKLCRVANYFTSIKIQIESRFYVIFNKKKVYFHFYITMLIALFIAPVSNSKNRFKLQYLIEGLMCNFREFPWHMQSMYVKQIINMCSSSSI